MKRKRSDKRCAGDANAIKVIVLSRRSDREPDSDVQNDTNFKSSRDFKEICSIFQDFSRDHGSPSASPHPGTGSDLTLIDCVESEGELIY